MLNIDFIMILLSKKLKMWIDEIRHLGFKLNIRYLFSKLNICLKKKYLDKS